MVTRDTGMLPWYLRWLYKSAQRHRTYIYVLLVIRVTDSEACCSHWKCQS